VVTQQAPTEAKSPLTVPGHTSSTSAPATNTPPVDSTATLPAQQVTTPSLPDVTVPSVTVPSVTIPNVVTTPEQLPTVQLPTVQLPDVKLPQLP
jgi:hypothetical protein